MTIPPKSTTPAETHKVSIRSIQQAVAKRFDMTLMELNEDSYRDAVRARQIAMFLAKQLTGASFQEIARHFGGYHYSSVAYAVARIKKLSLSDKKLRIILVRLQDDVGSGNLLSTVRPSIR